MEKQALKQTFQLVLPHLGEKQQRIVLAAEAKALGHGGITAVAEAAGISRPVIYRGLREVEGSIPMAESDRARKPGGGRKKITVNDLTLLADLDALVDPETRGDPESPLRWTCKSARKLAAALREKGHFPPGASKWNKIEHRLFSFITMNWRGRPLVSHEGARGL